MFGYFSEWCLCPGGAYAPSQHPNGLGQSSCRGIVPLGMILTENRACQPAGSTKTRVCTKISSVIQLLFQGDVVEVTPPNHISNKMEGDDLDICDLI